MATSTEYDWDGTKWEKYSNHIYTYNSSNDEESELIQLWDISSGVFINYTLETRTFNTYGLIESITLIGWDKSSSAWKYNTNNTQIRYYYDYYNPTDIKNTTAGAQSGINIFPNPANNEIHVNIDWQLAHETSIIIYNSFGQSVYQSTDNAAQKLSKLVNTSSLPTGDYIIVAKGGDELFSHKLLINR